MNKTLKIIAVIIVLVAIADLCAQFYYKNQAAPSAGPASNSATSTATVATSSSSQTNGTGNASSADYKNISYSIDGQQIKLVNGVSDVAAAPGSASRIVTRYFGNEIRADLNGDSREDIAFIVTQQTGGSGTFYYAVAALNTLNGYVGTDGYLLGDRIAPQATTMSPNPKHKYVVVFNYADRKTGESFATAPSVGKSAYLKIDQASMKWAIVEPNFEGESR